MVWLLLLVRLFFLFLFMRQVLVLGLAIWTWQRSEIPYEPTPTKALKKLLTKIKLSPGEKIYDLGSGNGRVALFLAKKSAVKVVGIEKNWLLYSIAKIKKIFIPNLKGQITFKRQDLLKTNLQAADLIYVYFVPTVFKKMEKKFEQELKIGTKLISWRYPFEHPQFQLVTKFESTHTMFIYQKINSHKNK